MHKDEHLHIVVFSHRTHPRWSRCLTAGLSKGPVILGTVISTYEENVFTQGECGVIPGYDYHKQSLGELVVRLASHFPQKYIIRNEIYISK